MRNMSFALTTEQIINQSKTVTRRNGWKFAKSGDCVVAVEKCQGLKKGEKVKRICTLEIRTVKTERLDRLITKRSYGLKEVRKEGFPKMTPEEFVEMYCKANKCTPDTIITRISFVYYSNKYKPINNTSCYKCGAPGFKTDGLNRIWCEKCYEKQSDKVDRIFSDLKNERRNDPCLCGSLRKFKNCCINLK